MAITQPTISEATADSTEGTTDAGTGVKYVPHGAKPTDSPKLRTLLTQQTQQILKALEGVMGGLVFDREDGLNVGVKGLTFRLGTTTYVLPDDDVFLCTDDRVNYLWVDTDEVVEEGTAWPGTDHFKLAVVTCASGQVTAIVQSRHLNHTVGIDSAWSTFAAVQAVDMATFGLGDLGQLELTPPTELVVTAAAITVTKPWHTLDGEGDASDYLASIAASGTGARLAILSLDPSAVTGGRTITIQHGAGFIELQTGATTTFVMSSALHFIVLMRDEADGSWRELLRTPQSTMLSADLDGQDIHGLARIDKVGMSESGFVISGGSIIYGNVVTLLSNEAAAADDDLDTVTGAIIGNLLLLTNGSSVQTTHVKHAASGANKFSLLNGHDCDLTAKGWLLVKLGNTSGMWEEISRSPIDIAHLAGTSRSIPYEKDIVIAGALSAGVSTIWIPVRTAFTLISATGVVATEPTGGAEVIDVQVDPGGDGTGFQTIFANGGERINITDGTVSDTSAVKDHAVTAGSIIRLEITTHTNSAADLTVTLHGQIAVQAAP